MQKLQLKLFIKSHMKTFPEPPQKYAAACENWDIGPSRKGPKQTLIILAFIYS